MLSKLSLLLDMLVGCIVLVCVICRLQWHFLIWLLWMLHFLLL